MSITKISREPMNYQVNRAVRIKQKGDENKKPASMNSGAAAERKKVSNGLNGEGVDLSV